jgi:hypothetical protein
MGTGGTSVEHKADHSPESSGEVKDAWSYNSTPAHVLMEWCLIKHKMSLHDVVLS